MFVNLCCLLYCKMHEKWTNKVDVFTRVKFSDAGPLG